MLSRGVQIGVAAVLGIASGQAMASPVHPAGKPLWIGTFFQAPVKGKFSKILYYKNEDVVKTTSTTTKTPIYTSVQVPVYTTVKAPIYNSKGQITGYKTTQVQTGTTTVQKLTGYNSVTTKSTAITPKAELYTTNGSSTVKSAAPVLFALDASNGPFAAALKGPQYALFSFAAVSTSAPSLTGGTFSQLFDSGTLSFTRTTPLYKLNKFGNPTGAALTNLLTVTFTDAVLTAGVNGTTMGFSASSPASTINFTSDFRSFTKPGWLTAYDFALAGNSASAPITRATIDPSLTNVTGTRTLNSFRVATVGTFAASAVPEPANWLMMLVGFGLIGLVRRTDVRSLARVTL